LAEDRWRFVRGHPLDLAAVALPTVRSLRLVASIAVTAEGRVVGGVLMIVGIATMGAVTAAIASQLINPRQSAQPQPADERVHQLEAQIAHLTAQLDSARATSPR
jgi:voltage-gated potassium channel